MGSQVFKSSQEFDDSFIDTNDHIGVPIRFAWKWPANPLRSHGRLYIEKYSNVVAYFQLHSFQRKCHLITSKQEYLWKDVGIGGWTKGISGILYDSDGKIVANVTQMPYNIEHVENVRKFKCFKAETRKDVYYVTFQAEMMLKYVVNLRTQLLSLTDQEGRLIMHAKPGRFCKEFTQVVSCEEADILVLIFLQYANFSSLMASR